MKSDFSRLGSPMMPLQNKDKILVLTNILNFGRLCKFEKSYLRFLDSFLNFRTKKVSLLKYEADHYSQWPDAKGFFLDVISISRMCV